MTVIVALAGALVGTAIALLVVIPSIEHIECWWDDRRYGR